MINEKDFNKIFSENLIKYMEKTKTSRADLAKLLDVSVTSVANWINGLKTPRMDKVDKMCSFFCIRRSDLIEDHSQSSEPFSSSTALNEPEEKLLTHYRNLNEEGQEKLVEYAEDLEASGRYIKNNEFDILQEEDA